MYSMKKGYSFWDNFKWGSDGDKGNLNIKLRKVKIKYPKSTDTSLLKKTLISADNC